MRIAFIVSQFPMLSETFILNQVTGLIERGYEVDIYTERFGDWDYVHPDVNNYQLRERTFLLESVPQNYGLRVIKGLALLLTNFHKQPRLIFNSLNIFESGLQAAGLWLLYSAISLINRPNYDIIHCQFGTQGYRGWFLQQLIKPKPKLILMFRGHDISSYIQQKGEQVYQPLFKAADLCLANCEFFRQRVIELGCAPDKITVHRSGLDVNKFPFRLRSHKSSEPVIIATVGRLVEKKGIEYAIRAVVKQAKYYSVVYYIIGDGTLRPSLEKLIQELEAEDYIHLLGGKNEAEIIDLLSQTHLFIAPSVTAADGNQDAPINVLKEAMAMSIPVLSTLHGGIPELVEDGVSGYLVPERDVDALSQRLGDLLSDTQGWEAMGKAGRAFVEQHYEINSLNDRLVELYLSLNHG